MTNPNKNFVDKSKEELAVLALRLKLQLLEGRFDVANKNDKKYNPRQTKKMIARILTELTHRGFKFSSGAHGLSLINLKDNKIISLNKEAAAAISAAEKQLIKDNADFSLGETAKEKDLTKKDGLAPKINLMDKIVLKDQSENKQKTQIIRKTSSGGGK